MSLLRSVLVAAALALVTVVHTQTNISTSASPVATTYNSSDDISLCGLCRDKGICTQAFQGCPGVYCGSWINESSARLPCCCAAMTPCEITTTNYECKCLGAISSEGETKKIKSTIWERIMVATVVLCAVLGAVYFFVGRSQSGNENDEEELEVGQTAYKKLPDRNGAQALCQAVAQAPLSAQFHQYVHNRHTQQHQ